jgi:23S rRNA pseudouridine1911/1915/1917 synthase
MEPIVLYEDEELVAIAKPAGMMTHPDAFTDSGTVSDWFAARYPASAEVGEPQTLPNGTVIARPGVVHRLDRDTSGVLLLAKTQDAHARLKAAFQARTVKKTYLAVVYGTMREAAGTIDMPIGRSRKDFRLRSAQRGAKGMLRDAVTRWERLGEYEEGANDYSLLRVMPETGRTHQIRVHLKAIHHPIACDPLYAPGRPCDLGLTRVALHAYLIEYPTVSGEVRDISAPIPGDLRAAVSRFPDAEALVGFGAGFALS